MSKIVLDEIPKNVEDCPFSHINISMYKGDDYVISARDICTITESYAECESEEVFNGESNYIFDFSKCNYCIALKPYNNFK